ncbi:MAG: ornithine cyclodeaminase [Rhodobacteraceae bacterium HLUCCA12]|nr:MAG: ornithine cyclodeaminase [Rhodobacteraceae bacterium HLUCCA12]
MIVLSQADVAALLPMTEAIAVVARAMQTVSQGGATLPLRTIIDVGGENRMGMMPGAMADPACYGIKLVSLFPGNPASGRSSHQGAMVLFDSEHGEAVAVMNAGLLTALRTAAASGVATQALARPDARVLTIIGTGEQARHHLDAMLSVRPIDTVRVIGRRPEAARDFVAGARAAYPAVAFEPGTEIRQGVAGADIVCTVTAAATPILCGDWVDAGTHLNVVGASVPSKREIDVALVVRAALFVDYRPSTFAQAGEIIAAIDSGCITPDHVRAEIGEVLSGTRPGRGGGDEITLYRSLGIAAQDLACAMHCLDRAKARGIGIKASID